MNYSNNLTIIFLLFSGINGCASNPESCACDQSNEIKPTDQTQAMGLPLDQGIIAGETAPRPTPSEQDMASQEQPQAKTEEAPKPEPIPNQPVNPEDTIVEKPADDATNSETAYVVASNGLNVRQGPGMNFPIVKTLRKGEQIISKGREGIWVMISEKEFVSINFLTDASHTNKAITNNSP